MKKTMILAAMSAVSLALFAKTSTPAGFTDDLDAAIEASKKSGKTVYAVFSGSDWCHWCKVLEKDYLSKKEFVDEASKSFELVYIDSPNDKTKLSEKAAKNNPDLVKKYRIRGFPTVKFIAADGSASDASRPGSGVTPKAYAESLAKEIKYRPLIDKHIQPLKNEVAAAMRAAFENLIKIGDPFSKKTEEEQRAAYGEIQKKFGEIIAQMTELRGKIAKTEVPAEIAHEKENLLKRLDSDIKGMKSNSSMTFEDAKKLDDARKSRRGKRKIK
jgi:protein disulfide-isomerase